MVLGDMTSEELILPVYSPRGAARPVTIAPVALQLIVLAVQLIVEVPEALMELVRVREPGAIAVVAVMVVVKTQRGLVVLAAQAAVREVQHPTILVAERVAAV